MFSTSNDIILSQSITGTGVAASEAVPLINLVGIYIRLVTTGTAVGSMQVQVSVKKNPKTDSDWDNYSAPIVYTASSTAAVNLTDLYSANMRVVLTNTSGASTCVVQFNAKSV